MVTSNREMKEESMGNKGHNWGKSKTHPRMPSLMRKKGRKMSNLNTFGKKHLEVYLNHYAMGLINFKELCRYSVVCFNDRT